MIADPAVVEEIRVRTLRWLQEHRKQTAYIVDIVGEYRPTTIYNFLQPDGPASPHVAMAIIHALPEIGAGLPCPYCRR